jgi:iron complex transport system substrate-binding protein
MRIVSLLPAATEICFAQGLGEDVFGVSPECDFPPLALEKPVASRSLVPTEGKGSAETSRLVGERLLQGGALYALDVDALRLAQPDVILSQALCDVCAPAAEDVRAVAERMPDPPEVLSLDPHRLEDILDDIRRVGRACGATDQADRLLDALRRRIDAVAARASRLDDRPATLCLEWLDPLFVAGHWVPEMVALAGGHDVLGHPGDPSARIDAKDIAMTAPQVAVLMPCGFHLDRVQDEAPILTSRPFWKDLPASRRDRVWLVDGSSFFNRPGPRIVDGLEILAHILHPDLFPKVPVHAAQRWVG